VECVTATVAVRGRADVQGSRTDFRALYRLVAAVCSSHDVGSAALRDAVHVAHRAAVAWRAFEHDHGDLRGVDEAAEHADEAAAAAATLTGDALRRYADGDECGDDVVPQLCPLALPVAVPLVLSAVGDVDAAAAVTTVDGGDVCGGFERTVWPGAATYTGWPSRVVSADGGVVPPLLPLLSLPGSVGPATSRGGPFSASMPARSGSPGPSSLPLTAPSASQLRPHPARPPPPPPAALRPNFFLSVRLLSESVLHSACRVQADIVQRHRALESALVSARDLHLTLGVMALHTPQALAHAQQVRVAGHSDGACRGTRADGVWLTVTHVLALCATRALSQVLQQCAPGLRRIAEAGGPLTLTLHGVHDFNGAVLFAKVR
jgi:hypothetical protein